MQKFPGQELNTRHSCNLSHSSGNAQILNALYQARIKPTPPQRQGQVLKLLHHSGNSWSIFFFLISFKNPFSRKTVIPTYPTLIADHWRKNSRKIWILFLFLFFGLFRAAPVAYGGSQARGLIKAVAASPHQSHSNARSEPHLQPTPQLTATLHPQPTERSQGWSPKPHGSQLDSFLLCHEGNSRKIRILKKHNQAKALGLGGLGSKEVQSSPLFKADNLLSSLPLNKHRSGPGLGDLLILRKPVQQFPYIHEIHLQIIFKMDISRPYTKRF